MTLILFTAPWCLACKGIKPMVIKACKDMGLDYQEIDVGADEASGVKGSVCSLPTIVLERDGQECARIEGAISREWLESMARGVD